MSGPFSSIQQLLSRLFRGPSTRPTPVVAGGSPFPAPMPLKPRVVMIVYNPVVDVKSGRRLIETMGWNDPDTLASGYIADIKESSGGLVSYQVVQRVEVNEIPVKADGFQYKPQDYWDAMRSGNGFHDPDAVDYIEILANWDLLSRSANNEFDEVWVFGGPFFGFQESTMAGARGFFVNGGPIPNTDESPRRFCIMGFNYERGVGEMLENLGHRGEFTLARVFGSESFLWRAYDLHREPTPAHRIENMFERFISYEALAPGRANVGTMHYAPNSRRDYDWASRTPVMSCCDDWLGFPNLSDPPHYRAVSAREWGDGDIRAHHKWWLSHLPKASGTTDGIWNNWWGYVIDPNLVK